MAHLFHHFTNIGLYLRRLPKRALSHIYQNGRVHIDRMVRVSFKVTGLASLRTCRMCVCDGDRETRLEGARDVLQEVST